MVSYQLPSKRVKLFAEWVLTLPRLAWELGASNISTTQVLDGFFFVIECFTIVLGNLFVLASGLTTQVYYL
jgi:hypothetical protein